MIKLKQKIFNNRNNWKKKIKEKTRDEEAHNKELLLQQYLDDSNYKKFLSHFEMTKIKIITNLEPGEKKGLDNGNISFSKKNKSPEFLAMFVYLLV